VIIIEYRTDRHNRRTDGIILHNAASYREGRTISIVRRNLIKCVLYALIKAAAGGATAEM